MGGIDKLFAPVAGRPLLAHSVAAFQDCAVVERMVLVLASDNQENGRRLVSEQGFDKAIVCAGGPRRQDSVRLGLEALRQGSGQAMGPGDWVAVHDGGRPLVSADLILRGLQAAQQTGAAAPAVPLVDTVKEAGPDRLVVRTLDRSRLWAVQTPQVFRYDLLLRAHREVTGDPSAALRAGFTDDAAMLEALGVPVMLFEGSRRNIKVTAPEDLEIARGMLDILSTDRRTD